MLVTLHLTWSDCIMRVIPSCCLQCTLHLRSRIVQRAVFQIINRDDLVLIQEIRDASITAIFELLDEVNAYV